ncbi:FAD-binding oxidoreductase [Bordetella genomosp. 7]|nr:FAD-binding oxidoreductase [Bordetella genomosp. 7]
MNGTVEQQHVDALIGIVGSGNCLSAGGDMTGYTVDYRGIFAGAALAVVRPANTAEVAAVVRYCARHGIPIVPQGGNTSLLGGAVPDGSGKAIVLSLVRMKTIHEVDPQNNTMTLDAGVTLHAVREAAEAAGRLFPLRIGSEGSCQIGGNISTNAGGTAVLRYGNMRELVLGLEVVLPDGEVWNGLRALRKDNTGYDLKHWFISAEGTLGIITRAVIKLFPWPAARAVAFAAVADPGQALKLLDLCKQKADTCLTAFELISAPALALSLDALGEDAPVSGDHPWYVLIELSSGQGQAQLDAMLLDTLEGAIEQALVMDAAVAANQAQAERMWLIREEISDAQTRTGGSVRCDISVPLSRIPEFVQAATEDVLREAPGARMVVYGHMGDGNVHFNPLRPESTSAADFLASHGAAITRLVDGRAAQLNGSISAEHGIGIAKRDELLHVKSRVELQLAWALKRALDPRNLMNPGKVLPPVGSLADAGTP